MGFLPSILAVEFPRLLLFSEEVLVNETSYELCV